MKIDYRKLILSLVLVWSAGIIGSLFTFPSISTWYASLNKSSITPPNWLFSPMWTTLYVLMAVSFYLVWLKGFKKKDARLARCLFMIQLGLNALWSIIFFGMQQIVFGLIEIVFLWFFILATIIEFRQLSKPAAYLLLPYLAWVTLATILNLSIALIN